MTSTTSLIVGLFSILCLKQLQVVGVAENLNHREFLCQKFDKLVHFLNFTGMTKPEQELLAKYLLQQLTSKDSAVDPVLARLAREDLAAGGDFAEDDLLQDQSQTIATIVPAPPGLDATGDKKSDNKNDQCKTKILVISRQKETVEYQGIQKVCVLSICTNFCLNNRWERFSDSANSLDC